jgi:hypothetical protein
MSDRVLARAREALGADAVGQDPEGRPRVSPESTDGMARAMALAHNESWTVRIEGRGTWCPPTRRPTSS